MKPEQATVGTRVRTLTDFVDVPRGTEGVIDQDYQTGVMVAWDLPVAPLPPDYKQWDGYPPLVTGIIRDGFDKQTELIHLEPVTLI